MQPFSHVYLRILQPRQNDSRLYATLFWQCAHSQPSVIIITLLLTPSGGFVHCCLSYRTTDCVAHTILFCPKLNKSFLEPLLLFHPNCKNFYYSLIFFEMFTFSGAQFQGGGCVDSVSMNQRSASWRVTKIIQNPALLMSEGVLYFNFLYRKDVEIQAELRNIFECLFSFTCSHGLLGRKTSKEHYFIIVFSLFCLFEEHHDT